MKSKNQYIWPVLLLILVLIVDHPVAQPKVQVVTQEISKIIEWSPGMSLMLNGENAEIYCTSHQSNSVEIGLTIISKHEDRSKAVADLKKMKWLTEVKNNVLYVRNYIELSRNESKPESALKVVYNIKIPEKCSVDVKDYFGKINCENIHSSLNIKSEFSQINLIAISGVTTINTVFGNVTATRIPSDLAITSNRSDINLSDFGGKIKINAILAKINIGDLKPVATVHIEAEKSVINLKIDELNRYGFQFDLINCEFIKPANMFPDFIKNDREAITASYHIGGEFPLIEINLNIGSLTIEQQ